MEGTYYTENWFEDDQKVLKLCEVVSINMDIIAECLDSAQKREILASFAGRIQENFPLNTKVTKLVNDIACLLTSYFMNFSDPVKHIFSFIPSYKCSRYSGLEDLRLVSKSFNRDASILRQQWVEENLISLKIYGLKSADDAVNFIKTHNLKKINLDDFSLWINKKHLEQLVAQNIVSLQMDCRTIKDYPRMESVVHIKPINVCDKLLPKIAIAYPKLTSIDLSCVYSLSDTGFSSFADACRTLKNQENNHPMHSINLSCCDRITDVGLIKLLAAFPNLELIDLLRTDIQGEGLAGLLDFGIKLNKLITANLGNTFITDDGLEVFSKICPELSTINLSKTIIKDVGLAKLAKNCPKLASIDLSSTKITDKGLSELAKYCKELTHIDLGLTKVSDLGVIELAKDCPNLKTIELGCTKVTDKGLVELFKMCPKLAVVKLSSAKKITDSGLIALSKNAADLSEINLIDTQVTIEGIIYLSKNCNKLEKILFSKLPQKEMIKELKIKYPNIEYFVYGELN